MSDIAKPLREKLLRTACVSPPQIVSDSLARDGTRKWLLDVGRRQCRRRRCSIPETNRGNLCVSTRRAAPWPCQFCSTGRQGFNRNLSVFRNYRAAVVANGARRKRPGASASSQRRVDGNGRAGCSNFDNTVSALEADDRRGRLRTFETPRDALHFGHRADDRTAWARMPVGRSRSRCTRRTTRFRDGSCPSIASTVAECWRCAGGTSSAHRATSSPSSTSARRGQRRRGARTPAHRAGFAGALQINLIPFNPFPNSARALPRAQ